MSASGQPRVLFVTGRLDCGGAERHLTMLLPDLRRQGIAAELFVLERGGELETQLIGTDLPIAGVDRRSGEAVHLVRAATALFRKLRAMRPDVVHFFLPKPYLVGSAVAMLAGSKLRFMSRRSLAHYHRNHRWLARLERTLHRRTTVLLGNSRAVVEELIAETGKLARIGLIHNGVVVAPLSDEVTRSALRRELNVPDGCLVIAIVANLIGYKGHAELIAALGSIGSELPQPWRLLVVGRDEGIGAQLRRQAAQLGIGDNIMWLGQRPDANRLWAAADFGALVSHQEGFSNALVEAMAAGVPMVATAIGGNLDAIVDGDCGFLVPVADVGAIAKAVLILARDTPLRQTMGHRARARVERLFSQAACVERYLRLYRGLADVPHRPVQSLIDGSTPLISLNG